MFPSFYVLGRQLNSYAITAIIGGLLAGFYCCRAARKRNIDSNNVISMLLWSALGVLIGGHLLYGITNFDLLVTFIKNIAKYPSIRQAFHDLNIIFGGMVFYGGLIGGTAAAAIYLRIRKLNYRAYFDVMAPGIPLFHLFGRIGCFLGGCCYGIECTFGVTYTASPFPEANGVSRLPVPLIGSFLNLMLFLLLSALYAKNKCRGELLNLYFIIYPVGRFILEYFRGDSIRGFIGGLSTSQLISIIVFVTAVVYYIWKYKRSKDVAQ